MREMDRVKTTIRLNDGNRVPRLGFGTFKLAEADHGQWIVERALEIGYRLVDTASYYQNEDMVGRALAAASLPRSEIAVATKVWPTDFNVDDVKRSVERSLQMLGLDYLDILYIHWPSEGFESVWKLFEAYREQGIAKTIAVCNFHQEHLDRLAEVTGTAPAIDQLETHPYLQLSTLCEKLEARGIRHQSWGPLAQGKSGLLTEETVAKIAKTHGKTPAQVVLRWHLERGSMVLVKTKNEDRLLENFQLFDFSLGEADMEAMTALEQNQHFSKGSDTPGFLEQIRRR
jgi:diketogulonate reductase-like aldo/keto reductase